MNAKDRMIIALDFPTMEAAKNLVEKIGDGATFYKVGLELFLNSKGEMIDYLASKGKKIFNVHASGGKKMMSKVVEEVKSVNPDNIVIGVTVLTSLSAEDVEETFHSKLSLAELALNWAKLGKTAGLDGVVCSPWEAKLIKEACGNDFKTVCPGVRPRWSATNDQERIMTPKDAIVNGCDFLVIGRPITKNEDPANAAKLVAAEIEEGMKEAGLC